ncbi:alpha/beta hydrolase fold [Octadecabacter temperatus]|uniref:Alpha/beta hydrolase fold protein n=1 Tax=Octadecabacter temperatus TaxID=1458307 RepID=A0A0K0Y8N4_9RHOB|nr:alpha/beta hydrolase [Octadecabacter temperatus]AKS47246.1 alpha/beta hydrolase fold protein [Octadecabacter temperatus]SIO44855.1 alpha/beta hydrolase fold [Octadecabacter temperatus]
MIPDQAYANSTFIPDGENYYGMWEAKAAAFRAGHEAKVLGVSYGAGARNTFDMFHPVFEPRGTVIVVHGGYWMAGSPTMFSHLAAGAVAQGFSCAMPSHTLAPNARLSEIVNEVAMAIAAIAAQTSGRLYLVGHSAGGHLVARMACADMAADWSPRVRRVMAISPLSDLAPLMETSMNKTLRIDADEAKRESPIQHRPQGIPVTVWVGGGERPAFLDQAKWLRDVWDCDLTVDSDKHHFDVIEGLEDPTSAMMRALFK